MAFEPIQPSTNSLSLANTVDSNKLNKPLSLAEQLEASKRSQEDDKKTEEKNKGRDEVELSQQARDFFDSVQLNNRNESKIEFTKSETKALEFRGLQQIAKNRPLTDNESNKLNQIKEDFAKENIDEATIKKLAEKKIQEIEQTAPKLVQQLDEGDITGDQFRQLVKINESLNKANGFGVSDEDQQKADSTSTTKIKSAFDSFTEVTKDRQLTRNEISTLEQLSTQLSTIQGFQINVRDTVGQDGVLV